MHTKPALRIRPSDPAIPNGLSISSAGPPASARWLPASARWLPASACLWNLDLRRCCISANPCDNAEPTAVHESQSPWVRVLRCYCKETTRGHPRATPAASTAAQKRQGEKKKTTFNSHQYTANWGPMKMCDLYWEGNSERSLAYKIKHRAKFAGGYHLLREDIDCYTVVCFAHRSVLKIPKLWWCGKGIKRHGGAGTFYENVA